MQAAPPFQRVAVAGLRRVPGAEADALLAFLAEHGEAAVRAEAAAAIAARRKGGGHG